MPLAKNKCPECGFWEIAKDDVYCGWCGKKFENFRLEINRTLFIFHPDMATEIVNVTLKNLLFRDMTIHRFEYEREFCRVINPDALPEPYILAACSDLQIELEIDTVPFTEEEKEIELRFFTDVQDEPIRESIRFTPSPKLVFAAVNDNLDFTVENDEIESYPIEIEISEGCAILDEPLIDLPWLLFKAENAVRGDGKYFLDAKNGPRKLAGHLSADKLGLKEYWSQNKQNEISGTIKFGAGEKEIAQNIVCKIVVPPMFMISGTDVKPETQTDGTQCFEINRREKIYKGTRLKELIVTLCKIENVGGGNLIIESLKLLSNYNWIKSIEMPPEALTTNKPVPVFARLNLLKLVTGVFPVELEFVSNHRQMPKVVTRCLIHVTVEEITVFDGKVAFDFGTTNSCCAIYADELYQLVPLEWSMYGGYENFDESLYYKNDLSLAKNDKGKIFTDNSTTILSEVLYTDYFLDERNITHRIYDVGKVAFEHLKSDQVENSFVMGIKHKLGLPEPLKVEYAGISDKNRPRHANLLPEEIVADFLNKILGRLEYLQGKKISRCYFSHPVGYRQERLLALQKAFHLAGITMIEDNDIWPEPVCVAYYFIVQDILTKIMKDFQSVSFPQYLLIYDFGGGTTDISYFRIDGKQNKQQKIFIQPVILDQDGHRQLGGDNLTEAILLQFSETIRKSSSDIPLIRPFREYPGVSDLVLKIGKENFYRLWQEAEEAKFAISAGSEIYEKTISLKTKGKVENLIPVEIRNDWLKNKTQELMHPTIQIIHDLLKRNNEKGEKQNLDYIVLSGNSCKMPFVAEFIREQFPKIPVEYPTSWYKDKSEEKENFAFKECVAIGLSYLAENSKLGGTIKISPPTKVKFSTTELGVCTTGGKGKRIFTPVIKKGQQFDTWIEAEAQLFVEPGTIIRIEEQVAPDLFEAVADFHILEIPEWTTDDYDNAILMAKLSTNYELELKLVVMDESSEEILKEVILDKAKIPLTDTGEASI